jgi:hypothetical protein
MKILNMKSTAKYKFFFGIADVFVIFISFFFSVFVLRQNANLSVFEFFTHFGAHIDLELDEATKLTFGYAGEFASDARDSALRTELRVEF